MSAPTPEQWPIIFPHQQESADQLAERHIADIEHEAGEDVDSYWVVCDDAAGFWYVDIAWWDGSHERHRIAEVGW